MKPVHPQVRILLDEVETYRAKTGCTRTTFGKLAAGDGHFIKRLEEGRMPMFSTIDKVRWFIAKKKKL